ncbi:PREDICTED: A disintegrin and metalloproteinase with thrombospondin motifs 18-like [Branchiostoma belcheri]|uniref:A disintegrin and metalloproteinase with thrombospondin motifs 18-like n=1 Tax=Branchiostoma belcheri TaxID=7741 RepID=A0A6P5AC78_BRABE|nr:PREDICTED: A disintegrin and metalloproteinase with thrombospondin motifs 18-like [Branchiostoma belcheri]
MLRVTTLLCLAALALARPQFHEDLTAEDLAHYFGVQSSDEVPEYEIVSPSLHSSGRTRRSADGKEVNSLQYKLKAFDEDYHLKVDHNVDLLPAEFHVTFIGEDGEQRETPLDSHCYYMGELLSHKHSVVAVSTCEGLAGVLTHDDVTLFIQPLKKEHAEKRRSRRSTDTQEEKEHIVYKQARNLGQTDYMNDYDLDNDMPQAAEPRREEEVVHFTDVYPDGDLGRLDNTFGAHLQVEQHEDGSITVHQKPNVTQQENEPLTPGLTELGPPPKPEVEDPRPIQFVRASAPEKMSRSMDFTTNGDESGFRNNYRPYVEMMIVADKSMYQYHGSNVQNYVLTAMNVAASLYRDGTIGTDISLHVVKLIVLETDQSGLSISNDATTLLDSFCYWQQQHQPGESDHQHYDVATLITRTDLTRYGDPGILGLAKLSAACVDSRHCSVNEDSGLHVAFTIAHETGHNLGIRHDGDGNSCGDSVNVMATSSVSGTSAYEWSTCSATQLEDFLSTYQAQCLFDRPTYSGITMDPNMKPGQTYTADDQCRLAYGGNAYKCRFDPTGGNGDLCAKLFCHVTSDMSCSSNKQPMLDGTACGDRQWCVRGTCVAYGTNGPQAVDGGWSAWETSWGTCSRTCGSGVQFRRRYCNNPEPQHGGAPCSGDDTMFQLCNTQPCAVSQSEFRAQQCAATNNQPFNGQFYTWEPYMALPGDYLCQFYCFSPEARIYTSRGDKYIDGTRCNDQSDSDICVEGQCVTFGCDGLPNSGTVFDRCGVCDGNGNTCQPMSGTYTAGQKNQYVTFLTLPPGSTAASVTEANYWCHLAVRVNGRYAFSGNGVQANSGQYLVDGLNIVYTKSPEELTIAGPVPANTLVEIQVYRHYLDTEFVGVAPQVEFSYLGPIYHSFSGSEEVISFAAVEYVWDSTWRECSESCGTGTQSLFVQCVRNDDGSRVDDTYCEAGNRPSAQTRSCNLQACPAFWNTGSYGACSATCGGGTQTRLVQCMRNNGQVDQVVSDSECKTAKPATTMSCNTEACPGVWVATTWTSCSVTCGFGQITRTVTCRPDSNSPYVIEASNCDSSSKPPEVQTCYTGQCPAVTQRPVTTTTPAPAGGWAEGGQLTGCDVQATYLSGTVSRVGHQTNGATCSQALVVPLGKVMTIKFEFLNIDCTQGEYFAIVDGGSIMRYCGTTLYPDYTSKSNVLYVQHATKSGTFGHGYRLSFTSADSGTPVPSCEYQITQPTGTIQAPNYPNEYDSNSRCKWYINVKPGTTVNINVLDFEVEYEANCGYDDFKIVDSVSGQFERYCGARTPFTFQSTGNRVVLELNSDGSVGKKGFRLSYTSA